MRQAVSALAFLAALAAFLTFFAGGLLLLVVESSGERMTGALLAFGSAVAFGLALLVIFGRDATFAGRSGVIFVAAGFVAMLPVAALAFAVLRFAGVPGGTTALLDWSALAVGLILCFGAAAILVRGWRRGRIVANPERGAETEMWTAPPVRPAAWKQVPPVRFDADFDEDEVRVTPVRHAR